MLLSVNSSVRLALAWMIRPSSCGIPATPETGQYLAYSERCQIEQAVSCSKGRTCAWIWKVPACGGDPLQSNCLSEIAADVGKFCCRNGKLFRLKIFCREVFSVWYLHFFA